jgi:tRNA (cytidine/uridine-2'-O-)-methyltransferase
MRQHPPPHRRARLTGVLHLVLVEPEIPPNTGTTARLCAATATRLHLVGPLGFSLEDRYLRRAGLDYWPWVDLRTYDHWEDFRAREPGARLILFSTRATRLYTDVRFRDEDFLVFGGETRGLPATILEAHRDDTVRIPMSGTHVRSLNLANAAAIGLYEALRQRGPAPSGSGKTAKL